MYICDCYCWKKYFEFEFEFDIYQHIYQYVSRYIKMWCIFPLMRSTLVIYYNEAVKYTVPVDGMLINHITIGFKRHTSLMMFPMQTFNFLSKPSKWITVSGQLAHHHGQTPVYFTWNNVVDTLRLRQNGCHFRRTFSNASFWMKMYEFWLRFHWSLFLRLN